MAKTNALNGQVAVISGSATGIGRGLAVGFAAQGAHIVGLDVDINSNAETAALVRAQGRECMDVHCDIGNAGGVARAIDAAAARFGRIDVLCNNAALWLDCALTTGTYASQTEAFARSMNVCALGSFNCARAVVPVMQRGGHGHILNLITEHIKEGHYITGKAATGYDCAKFSQWRLTETWAVELQPLGIRVNALCFGATDTPMLRAVSVPIAEAGMRTEDLVQAALNIMAHGSHGPTGQSYLFGTSGTPRAESLKQIAALAPQ